MIRNGGVGHRPQKLRVDPRVAVVGLGYWGPNLVRVLIDRTDVEVGWICDTDLSRLERFGRRYPSVQLTQDLDDVLDDPVRRRRAPGNPVFTHYELARRCLEAGKHTFVEKPLAPSTALAEQLIALVAATRPVADVRPHIPLQPPGSRRPRADPLGRPREALLRLGQPRQPGAASARRERDLGPRTARFLDPAVLAGWRAQHDPCHRARFDRARDRRRRVRDDGVRIGSDRERRAELAGAQQAQADRDRRL